MSCLGNVKIFTKYLQDEQKRHAIVMMKKPGMCKCIENLYAIQMKKVVYVSGFVCKWDIKRDTQNEAYHIDKNENCLENKATTLY